MQQVRPMNIISAIAMCAVFCISFGGDVLAQGAVVPAAEATSSITIYEILSIIASLVMVAYLAMPYFKKPDDKSKK